MFTAKALVILFAVPTTIISATKNAGVAFVHTNSRRKHTIELLGPGGRSRHGVLANRSSNSPLLNAKLGSNDDLFLLSFDGTLASTNQSKSWMAVCVALKVWPTLQSNMKELGMDPGDFEWERNVNGAEHNRKKQGGDQSHEWLLRKLSALSSITQQGNSPDAMLGCDAVLLARLLLEEQLLDGGRSNGRGGKYGGKFHPSSPTSDSDVGGGTAGERSDNVGSRPLTVGELFANWRELRDITRTKYPFVEELPDGKLKRRDPLPEIRRYLKDLFSATDNGEEMRSSFVPPWHSIAYDILFDYHSLSNDGSVNLRRNTMLLLGHDAQIPLALEALSSLGRVLDIESDLEFPVGGTMANDSCINDGNADSNDSNVKAIVTTSDKVWKRVVQQEEKHSKREDGSEREDISDDIKTSLFLVVPNPEKEETHSDMIERIVDDSNCNYDARFNRNVYVTHSSLEVLKQCKSFLGEDAPILSQGLRKCILPHTSTAVTLCLPEWADNVHPSQRNDGEMDPWLNLVREEEFLELISARIIEASMI